MFVGVVYSVPFLGDGSHVESVEQLFRKEKVKPCGIGDFINFAIIYYLGIIEFARIGYSYILVAHASRECTGRAAEFRRSNIQAVNEALIT